MPGCHSGASQLSPFPEWILAFGSIIEDELWEGKFGSNDGITNHENGPVDGGEVTEAIYSRDMKVRD